MRDLAHELGNIIFPLQVPQQLLQKNQTTPPTVEEIQQMLEEHLPLMNKLRENLRQAGKIARNAVEPHPQTVEFTDLVHRAVEEVQPLIEKREHHLEVRLPKPPVLVEADRELLQKAIAELLDNAARYTEPSGEITLLDEQENGELVLRIQDSRKGIPSDLLPYIFEPFVRGEDQFDFTEGNLGTGLTLVRKVAEKHHGTVEAHSRRPGQGSEFVMRLPLPK